MTTPNQELPPAILPIEYAPSLREGALQIDSDAGHLCITLGPMSTRAFASALAVDACTFASMVALFVLFARGNPSMAALFGTVFAIAGTMSGVRLTSIVRHRGAPRTVAVHPTGLTYSGPHTVGRPETVPYAIGAIELHRGPRAPGVWAVLCRGRKAPRDSLRLSADDVSTVLLIDHDHATAARVVIELRRALGLPADGITSVTEP